jgi:large-conductance mechanosensitive channel
MAFTFTITEIPSDWVKTIISYTPESALPFSMTCKKMRDVMLSMYTKKELVKNFNEVYCIGMYINFIIIIHLHFLILRVFLELQKGEH